MGFSGGCGVFISELDHNCSLSARIPILLFCCSYSNFWYMVYFALFSDYSSGFGGKYGVQADRVDKSAMGFDYQGKTEKHESQKGLLLRQYHSKVLNNSLYKSARNLVFIASLSLHFWEISWCGEYFWLSVFCLCGCLWNRRH